MGLVFRGIVWFGLYLALVLAPLAVALVVGPAEVVRSITVEIGVACGFIAFSLLVTEFALVSRLRAAADPFGTDALAQFHRLMALAALGFVAMHPILAMGPAGALAALNPVADVGAGRAGAIASWLVVILIATSVWRRRLRMSYELWRRIHGIGAVLIVAASLLHIRSLGRYSQVPALALLVVSYGALFLALQFRYRLLRPLRLWRRPWIVVENRDEGASTRTLVVEPRFTSGFTFEAGQFAWLITGRTPFSSQQHPITIASSAERAAADGVEFSIKALGDWSGTIIPALAPRTRLWVDGPYGAFRPDREPGQGLVLIAGGIGITPMRSILLTMREREDRRPVVLFFAARNWSRVVYREDLVALQRDLDLDVVYVFEEPETEWEGERGFVTAEVLERHLPRQFRRYQYFVCGPGPMMDALEEILSSLGIEPACIHTERFDVV